MSHNEQDLTVQMSSLLSTALILIESGKYEITGTAFMEVAVKIEEIHYFIAALQEGTLQVTVAPYDVDAPAGADDDDLF